MDSKKAILNLSNIPSKIKIGQNEVKLNEISDVSWTLDHEHDYIANPTITLHADCYHNDTSNYLSLRAGWNELKIFSSAGGKIETQEDDKIFFNNKPVFHSGSKEMTISQDETVGFSTRQKTSITPSQIKFTNRLNDVDYNSTIKMNNYSLAFEADSIQFTPGLSGVGINGSLAISSSKQGCIISPTGLESVMYGEYDMGQQMPLGYISCMGLAQMSDKDTKEDIKYINNNEDELTDEDCYNFFLNDFKPVSFKYKRRTIDSPELGFIAQDVDSTKLSNYILIKKENQPLSFNNYSFTSALAIAFQKALKEINKLKVEIEILKNK